VTAALAVGVNLLWCVPGEVGGSEEYLVRQLAGLREIGATPQQLDVRAYAPAALVDAHPALDRLGPRPARRAPHDGRSRGRRIVDESTWLHRAAAGEDLVHHGGGTAPVRPRRPYVLTVHDLQFRTFPEHFAATKRRYLDAVVPRSARRAAIVAVPSDYVRRSVATELRVPEERIRVVPHGYAAPLHAARTPEDELRARWSLGDGPVVVYPAMTHPHKHHPFLVRMLERSWRDPDLRLVLTGGSGQGEAALAAALAAAPEHVRRRVVRTGRVADADRDGLLAMALALVFPSRYEGFGAPVVEAMALGTPVVCSDATCLPEVVGGAGLVLPLEEGAWAGALDEVLRRRDELVAAGRRRAASFTVARSGEALRDAYLAAARR